MQWPCSCWIEPGELVNVRDRRIRCRSLACPRRDQQPNPRPPIVTWCRLMRFTGGERKMFYMRLSWFRGGLKYFRPIQLLNENAPRHLGFAIIHRARHRMRRDVWASGDIKMSWCVCVHISSCRTLLNACYIYCITADWHLQLLRRLFSNFVHTVTCRSL